MITVEELKELGFTKAADDMVRMVERKKKLALAYEHFRFVRQEKIDEFNNRLYEKTRKTGNYKTLSFTSISTYSDIPPAEVLERLIEAKKIGCFDSYEIAHIIEVKDPILFGRIKDCSDRFFIAQWDDDVKIEDILMPNEG